MKNRIYKSLFLGVSTAIVATASYALISPDNSASNLTEVSAQSIIKTVEPEPLVGGSSDRSFVENKLFVDNGESLSEPEPELLSFSHKIQKGESLSTIFSKLDLSKTDLHRITHANKLGKQFASIVVGKNLVLDFDSEGKVQKLVYEKNAIDSLMATRVEDDSFEIKKISEHVDKEIISTQITIDSSLFLDGKDAGLSDNIIMQLSEIFAWDIDFALSLRKNDQITVVYEKRFVGGEELKTGNILSAEFVNNGESFVALRFEDDKGNARYFSPEGKSMRKAFLRTPVEFARISSRFNLKRKHPVLNKIRAHKGVDYAASTGTPIKSTGKGKIVFRGKKGGYGNVVIVQHGQKYSTLYAHLSKFKKGQKSGGYIKQGEVIGYVGMSGLATGPHLHYEFRVNGRHRNPLTVKLPHADPIDTSMLAQFKQRTQPLLDQLNKIKATSLFAQNEI